MNVSHSDTAQLTDSKCPPGIDLTLLRLNHEIRTAVNAILGMTELLLESQMTREQGHQANVIRTSTDHLLRQSSALLDLARAESGSLQLHQVSFDLTQNLTQTLELLALLASHKGIPLRTDVSNTLPESVTGDPARISEVLIAVVRSAIDRSDGGEISITVAGDLTGTDRVNVQFSIATVVSAVPKIPYDVVDSCDFGVALELAKHLARMMGGSLSCTPELGVTCDFNVNLGVARGVAPIKGVFRLEPGVVGDSSLPLKILVAEDAPNNQLLVRAFLRNEPWEIHTAANGRIALEKVAAESYNLILMDLDMPEMDGYVATRQIRISESANQAPAVPIVALTAHNEAEAVMKSFEAGCTAHVTKPFSKAGLIDAIRRYAVAG